MTEIDQKIRDGSLNNNASVAELLKRQDRFTEDIEVPADLRSRGLEIFNTAIYTDATAALQTEDRVVLILQRTIEAVGALYQEHERRKTAIGAFQGTCEGGAALLHDAAPTLAGVSTSEPSSEDEQVDADAQINRLQAAIAARQKRRLATHGARPRMSAAAGVVKAFKRTASTPQPSRTSVRLTPKVASTSDPMISALVTTTVSKQGIKATLVQTRSLIVKLNVPMLYCVLHDRNKAISNADPSWPCLPVSTRAKRKKFKSEELVTSDLADDIEMTGTPAQDEPVEKGRRAMPSQTATSTGSTKREESIASHLNEADMDMHDAPPANKRTMRSQTRTSSTKSASPPTHPSPSPKSWSTTSASSSPSLSPLPPTFTTPNKPKSSHSSTQNYKFPMLPPLPPLKRPPFYVGATIALSNILDDHLLNPSITLLELIGELEDNKPQVDDWERRAVLKGGMWICGVLKDVGTAKGRGNGRTRLDIVELVRELERWIEREWDRVGWERERERKETGRESEEDGEERDADDN